MPGVRTKLNWFMGTLLSCLACLGGSVAFAATPSSGGVTVTPATLTIALAPAEARHSSTFTVTNHYAQAVTLHFAAVASPQNIHTPLDVSNQLAVAAPLLSIAAGQTATQTVTLTDNPALGPGSQVAALRITQDAAANSQVGVGASINIPVTTVKQAGAILSLGQGALHTSSLAWNLPSSLTASVHNTGNMIAIPHGYVTVQTPNGRLVSSGVVNVASAALSPDASLSLTTKLQDIHRSLWPGMYQLTFSYGLGHGQPSQTVTARILYLAWWHIILLLALLVGLGYLIGCTIQAMGQRVRQHAPVIASKKARLAEKGGT